MRGHGDVELVNHLYFHWKTLGLVGACVVCLSTDDECPVNFISQAFFWIERINVNDHDGSL